MLAWASSPWISGQTPKTATRFITGETRVSERARFARRSEVKGRGMGWKPMLQGFAPLGVFGFLSPHRSRSTAHRSPLTLLAAVLLAAFVMGHSSFAAESPLLIPFQGQVTNQTGQVTPDGQYTVIFNLYDQAVGGQPVWSERHVRIGVTQGMINVFLGSISSLAEVEFSQAKYLGITVDVDNLATTADPEMVPRSLILPAFHAKKAEEAINAQTLGGQSWSAFMVNPGGTPVNDPATGYLNGGRLLANSVGAGQLASGAVGASQIGNAAVTTDKIDASAVNLAKLAQEVMDQLVPAGTIHAYGGSTPPTGYLLCDGAVLEISEYPALFAAIGTNFGAPNGTSFNLPDLRGQFLRGMMPNLNANGSDSASGNAVTTVGNHPFNRTGMKVRVSGTLVTGLAEDTDYYIVNVGPDSLGFASTPEDARTGSRITISGSAAGMVIAQAEDPDVMTRSQMYMGGNEMNNPGSVQGDALQRITGRVHTSYAVIRANQEGAFTGSLQSDPNGPGGTQTEFYTSSHKHGLLNFDSSFSPGARNSSETRPVNVAVQYIIKH